MKPLGTERPEVASKGFKDDLSGSHRSNVSKVTSRNAISSASLPTEATGLSLSHPYEQNDDSAVILVPASSPGTSDEGSLSPLTSNDPYSPVKSKRNPPIPSDTTQQTKKHLSKPTTRRTSLAQPVVETSGRPPTERTRSSERLVSSLPFGMPYPSTVEVKEDFSITNEEDFWGIIADRESRANELRRASLTRKDPKGPVRNDGEHVNETNGQNGPNKGLGGVLDDGLMSNEDVADMREVEAVVVL